MSPIYSEVFTVGIFCGTGKPASFNDFIEHFVKEMQEIDEQGGIHLQGSDKPVPVNIQNFICDTPARAFAKMTRGHNYHQGCDRCQQEGVKVSRRRTFQHTDTPASHRLDKHFINQDDLDDYFVGVSSLCKLSIGMVTQFPPDYMHMVCLGVVRRMARSWKTGNRHLPCRLSSSDIKEVSARQKHCTEYLPAEFRRKCRSLDFSDRWKATECRQFLLYVGPVVLKGILSEEMYEHYMLLSIAISCLCSQLRCTYYADYCSSLLNKFVKNYADIYGKEQMVYNVHGLLHLCDSVKKFGPLDQFSAFPFESYLGRLKKLVRRQGRTVVQLS